MNKLNLKYFYLVEKMSNEDVNDSDKDNFKDESALSNNLNLNANNNPIIMLVDWERLFYSRVEKV